MGRMIFKTFVGAVKLAIPVVIRALDYLARITATAVSALWLGVPITTGKLADVWTKKLLQHGVPPQYEDYLYSFFIGLAGSVIFTGWIILAFITVGFMTMIF